MALPSRRIITLSGAGKNESSSQAGRGPPIADLPRLTRSVVTGCRARPERSRTGPCPAAEVGEPAHGLGRRLMPRSSSKHPTRGATTSRDIRSATTAFSCGCLTAWLVTLYCDSLSTGGTMRVTLATLACTVLALILFTGCAAQKEWTATGGSRSDGTVELAFEYGLFEKPQVDESQGVQLAAATCAGWGYAASQPFGGTMRKCEAMNSYGDCISWLVTRKYQCLGAPSSSPPTQQAIVIAPPQAPAYISQPPAATAAVGAPQPVAGGAQTSAPAANMPAPSAPTTPVVNPNAPTNHPPSFENL
jgi:hypothetical protein